MDSTSITRAEHEEFCKRVEAEAEIQKAQGEKLDELENRDGEMWRRVSGYVITSVIGLVIGYLFHKLGL